MKKAGATVNEDWVKDTGITIDGKAHYDTTYVLDAKGDDLLGYAQGKPARLSRKGVLWCFIRGTVCEVAERQRKV